MRKQDKIHDEFYQRRARKQLERLVLSSKDDQIVMLKAQIAELRAIIAIHEEYAD